MEGVERGGFGAADGFFLFLLELLDEAEHLRGVDVGQVLLGAGGEEGEREEKEGENWLHLAGIKSNGTEASRG